MSNEQKPILNPFMAPQDDSDTGENKRLLSQLMMLGANLDLQKLQELSFIRVRNRIRQEATGK